MRKGLLGSLALLVAGAGLALAQPPAPPPDGPAEGVACDSGPAPEESPGPPEEPGDDDRPPRHVWFRAEYLFWRVKGGPLPEPLVTTTTNLSNPALFGSLGQPGTTVIFGGQSVDYGDRSGGRFTLGWWLDPDRLLAGEIRYFFLSPADAVFHFGSDANGNPPLARPVVDARFGVERREAISFPGVLAGSVAIVSRSDLWGAELAVSDDTGTVFHACTRVVVGLRYLRLDEDLRFNEILAPIAGAGDVVNFNNQGVAFPSVVTKFDRFKAMNHFIGAEAGGQAEWAWRRLFLDVRGTVGLGGTYEAVRIDGNSMQFAQGLSRPPTQTFPGALLALPTNIGLHSHGDFAVVPEGEARVGYDITPGLRMFVGYSALYWSAVLRPGDQIDRTINPTQAPTAGSGAANATTVFGPLVGPARPLFEAHTATFFAHGVSLGLELRY